MAEEVVEKKKRERIKRSAPQKVELPKSVSKDIPTEQTLTVAEAEETISTPKATRGRRKKVRHPCGTSGNADAA